MVLLESPSIINVSPVGPKSTNRGPNGIKRVEDNGDSHSPYDARDNPHLIQSIQGILVNHKEIFCSKICALSLQSGLKIILNCHF